MKSDIKVDYKDYEIKHLSNKLKTLDYLVYDIQTDCKCLIEKYDSCDNKYIKFIDYDKPIVIDNPSEYICLDMLENFIFDDLKFIKCLQLSKNYSTNNNYEYIFNILPSNCNLNIKNSIKLDFVDDVYYSLPECYFLGAFTFNLRGANMFLFPSHMKKTKFK